MTIGVIIAKIIHSQNIPQFSLPTLKNFTDSKLHINTNAITRYSIIKSIFIHLKPLITI